MIDFKIVTYGRLSEEFYNWAEKEYPSIKFSHARSINELKSMLKVANAYSGFNEFEDIDLSRLKWIHSFGAGVDSFLKNKSLDINSTLISRTTGNLGKKIGEFCLAHVLNEYKKIKQFANSSEVKKWNQISTQNLFESKILILGTGNIGSGIASTFNSLVKSITGLNISGNKTIYFDKIIRIDDMYDNFDVIINTLPETDKTANLLGKSFFKYFNNVIFINVGRGSSLPIKDLEDCINLGYISKAILDVFEKEPLGKSSSLWNHPKITITPHISGITTIADVTSSFTNALNQIVKNNHETSFVNFAKGY